MIRFTAELEPVPFPRPMSNGTRRFNPPRYSYFKEALGFIAKRAMSGRAPLKGNVKLSADFYKLKPKNPASKKYGDLDNLLKAVMDALNGICYQDDSQVTRYGSCGKYHGDPHISIQLEELP